MFNNKAHMLWPVLWFLFDRLHPVAEKNIIEFQQNRTISYCEDKVVTHGIHEEFDDLLLIISNKPDISWLVGKTAFIRFYVLL